MVTATMLLGVTVPDTYLLFTGFGEMEVSYLRSDH